VLLRIPNHEVVWSGIVDVVQDYFRIEREDPVSVRGSVLTEGRIDTFPTTGATYLEPWNHDSADAYQRWESTLQSIRRYAVIKVIPDKTGTGFWVEVAVYKDLEKHPPAGTRSAGAALFRNDNSPNGNATVLPAPTGNSPNSPAPTGDAPNKPGKPPPNPNANQQWISQGRDPVLEQRIIGEILNRFNARRTARAAELRHLPDRGTWTNLDGWLSRTGPILDTSTWTIPRALLFRLGSNSAALTPPDAPEESSIRPACPGTDLDFRPS